MRPFPSQEYDTDPFGNPLDAADIESRQKAASDLELIYQLTTSKPWKEYYQRRIAEKVRELESRILYGELPDDQILKERAILLVLKDIQHMTDLDATGARSVLGIEKSETPVL
jgi:hypothetical protein